MKKSYQDMEREIRMEESSKYIRNSLDNIIMNNKKLTKAFFQKLIHDIETIQRQLERIDVEEEEEERKA